MDAVKAFCHSHTALVLYRQTGGARWWFRHKWICHSAEERHHSRLCKETFHCKKKYINKKSVNRIKTSYEFISGISFSELRNSCMFHKMSICCEGRWSKWSDGRMVTGKSHLTCSICLGDGPICNSEWVPAKPVTWRVWYSSSHDPPLTSNWNCSCQLTETVKTREREKWCDA